MLTSCCSRIDVNCHLCCKEPQQSRQFTPTAEQGVLCTSNMEICIKDKAIPEILTWLDSLYEEVTDPIEMDDVVTVNCYSSGESVPVTLTLGVEDTSFVGVWFNSDRLHWKNLVELANQASRYFGVAVRYEKTDLSSVFYEVSNGQTREVNW